MLIKRDGIYKNINPSEYGSFLALGFVKVTDKNDMIIETKVEVEEKVEEPKVEIISEPEPEIIQEKEEEEIKIEVPKSKKNKNKKSI